VLRETYFLLKNLLVYSNRSPLWRRVTWMPIALQILVVLRPPHNTAHLTRVDVTNLMVNAITQTRVNLCVG